MQKTQVDASCSSISTIPKMQSGGSLLGGWNLLHNAKMYELWKNREEMDIAKTALLQTL